MSSPGAGFVARLLLVLLGVAMALAGVEAALRLNVWFGLRAMQRSSGQIDALMSTEEPLATIAPPPPRSIMEILHANSSETFEGVLYRFNERGIRGPSRVSQPPPSVFRIVVVGDSVTMGHGVAEEDTYPALLEQQLNLLAGGDRFEVINLGLSNANLPSSVDRLRELGVPLRPDLIVYGFTLNDIEGRPYRRSTASADGDAYLQNLRRFSDSPLYLLRGLWPRAMSLLTVLHPPRGSYPWELNDNYFDNPTAWKVFDDALEELAAIGAELDVCVHVLVHTHLVYLGPFHPFGPIYRKVEEAAVARGLTVTQTLADFDGLDERRLVVAWNDPHPNAAGDRVFAQGLLRGLLRLPERCWKKWYRINGAQDTISAR